MGTNLFPELSKRNILKDACFVAEELLSEGFEEYDLSYTNEGHDLFYSICALLLLRRI